MDKITVSKTVVLSSNLSGSVLKITGYRTVWLIRAVWDREIAGSNPAIQINACIV